MPNEHLSTEAERHPLQASKKIAKVTQAHYGHVHLEFEDGSMDVIRREELKGAKIQAGMYWPPLPEELELSPIQEESHATPTLAEKPAEGNGIGGQMAGVSRETPILDAPVQNGEPAQGTGAASSIKNEIAAESTDAVSGKA